MTRGWKLLGNGFRALGEWRVLLILWGAATLAALPAFLTVRQAASRAFGGTTAGRAIVEGKHPDASFYMIDFLFQQKSLAALAPALLVGLILTILLQSFLTGGVIEAAASPTRTRFRDFIAACGAQFGRNLTITFIFLFLASILVGMWFGFNGQIDRGIFKNDPPNPAGREGYRLFYVAIGVLIFLTLRNVFDVARAVGRFDPERGVFASIGEAFRQFFSSPLRLLGFSIFWLLFGAIGQLLLFGAEWDASPRNGAAVFGVLLLGQLAILWRCAARLGGFGSVVRFAEVGHLERVERERIERERLAAEERERIAAEERERIAAQERERIAAEESERLAAEERERERLSLEEGEPQMPAAMESDVDPDVPTDR